MEFFCYKSAPKGPIPLWIFTKFGFGEGLPGSHPQANVVTLKYGLTAAKIGNFWYKFAPKGYVP